MSWSDTLDQPGNRSRPGYQLLHRWSVLFCARAQALLPSIVDTFSTTSAQLSEGWSVAGKAQQLQLAWLHWEALARWNSTSPAESEVIFRQLVRQLAKVPSHEARRDANRRFPYDVLIQ